MNVHETNATQLEYWKTYVNPQAYAKTLKSIRVNGEWTVFCKSEKSEKIRGRIHRSSKKAKSEVLMSRCRACTKKASGMSTATSSSRSIKGVMYFRAPPSSSMKGVTSAASGMRAWYLLLNKYGSVRLLAYWWANVFKFCPVTEMKWRARSSGYSFNSTYDDENRV